jgi:ribosome-binding factor A
LKERALDRSKAFIRSNLARRINMRKTPQLHFKYDGTLDYANKIDRGLKEVMKNSKKED